MIRLCLVACVAALLAGCAADRSSSGGGGHDFSGPTVGVSGAFSHE
jgi:hypothetical protein